MKKLLHFSFYFLFICFISSCNFLESEPCNFVICENGGICDQGECVCLTGFEGADCSILTRSKFLNSYRVIITDKNKTYQPADTEIIADPDNILKMEFDFDFMPEFMSNFPTHVELTVIDSLNIEFAEQSVNDFFPAHEGTGDINSDGIISIQVNTTDGNNDFIHYILSPQ